MKQAVLGWMNGEPNLGLLVTAQNLFEDEIAVEFSRRNDYHHSKQPILVLFDDDNSGRSVVAPRYYAYESQDNNKGQDLSYEKNEEEKDYEGDYEHYRKHKRQWEGSGQPEKVSLVNRREPEFFQRQKKRHEEGKNQDGERYGEPRLEATRRRRRDARSFRGGRPSSAGIVSKDRSRITRILTSMDIYERAAFRERLRQAARDKTAATGRRRRPVRSASNENPIGASASASGNASECTRHELYVDFRDIGLSSSIIAPAGYSAYQCKGVCEPPLSQDQRPTNHATIQAIVHKMSKGVERPCCVPTKLLSTSILFYDDNENVVLKMYEDMIADRCGCR